MTSVMASTTSRRKAAADSSKLGEKDIVSRLAEAGEDALQRLSDLPGGQRAVTAFNDLRNRVDDLGKKVRGIDALEARVAKLEKELATLKRGSSSRAPTRKSS
jgi:hypothetical protein